VLPFDLKISGEELSRSAHLLKESVPTQPLAGPEGGQGGLPHCLAMHPISFLRFADQLGAAFAGGFIDDGIDERGLARTDGLFHRPAQLGRGRGMHAHATEGLHQLVSAHP
jgi:hypothetical protein